MLLIKQMCLFKLRFHPKHQRTHFRKTSVLPLICHQRQALRAGLSTHYYYVLESLDLSSLFLSFTFRYLVVFKNQILVLLLIGLFSAFQPHRLPIKLRAEENLCLIFSRHVFEEIVPHHDHIRGCCLFLL